jgi:hypothetical protein
MARKFLLLFLSLLAIASANAQMARVQFANNCSDVSLTGIDIYVNGMLHSPGISYRMAMPFADVMPGNVSIAVAPANSTSVNDAFYTTSIVLTPNDTVVAIANGLKSTTGYTPLIPFGMTFYTSAREIARDASNNVDLVFVNGSTDAGIIDIKTGVDTWIDNLGIGNGDGYHEFAQANTYTFRVTNNTGSIAYNTYNLSFQLQHLGLSGVVITSGFLSPSANSNGPAFGTYIVFADGGPFVSIPTTDPELYSRVQLINNSADIIGDTVDVWINGAVAMRNIPFQTATPFFDVPANQPLQIGIASENSTTVIDTFYNLTTTFDSAGRYILLAQGIKSTGGYNPAPPFELKQINNALEYTSNGNTAILFSNGGTDMPGYTIKEGANTWVTKLLYGDVTPNYLSVPTANGVIDMVDGNTSILSGKYKTQLANLDFSGKAIMLLGSGFKNSANNSNGKKFDLYYSTAEGGPFIQLVPEPIVSVDDVATLNKINLLPNPASDFLIINSPEKINGTATIVDITGKTILITDVCNNKLNVSTLTNGLYFIKVNISGQQHLGKFVKQ